MIDTILLVGNGLAYALLGVAYLSLLASYGRSIRGGNLAAFTCIVFAILFFYRASGVDLGESATVTWLFRIGVFTYTLGAALALRALTQPDLTKDSLP